MATWAQFAEAQPAMAAIGAGLLEQFHLAYLATVRADGSPRVHPVSPFIVEGRLIVATPPESPKARDQLRDGRCVIHMLPGKDDAEFRVRGRARLIEPGPLRDAVLRDGPHYVKEHDCLFEYEIDEAATAYWVNVGQPGTYPVRERWREPRR
jgi:hypothetical protein